MNWIVVAVLIGVIIYQGVVNWIDRRDAREREEDLMNRLMAGDFAEYVKGKGYLKKKPDEPMTEKERMKGLELAEKQFADVLEVV